MRYYDNNVVGSLRLFEAMARAGVHRLVFSSSATVYGDPHTVPIDEGFPLQATNPYGRSKLVIEDMLRDIGLANAQWRVAVALSARDDTYASATNVTRETDDGVGGAAVG